MELRDNISRTLWADLQPLWRNWWPAKQSNSVWKKTQNKAYITPFKVIQIIEVGINRKDICDFLLMINSNWHPDLVLFRSYCRLLFKFKHFPFLSPLWGFKNNVNIWLIGKRVVNFIYSYLLVIELFFARCSVWGATGENRSKIGYFAPTRSVWPEISGRMGHPPLFIFARIVRPMNDVQLWSWEFLHKEAL